MPARAKPALSRPKKRRRRPSTPQRAEDQVDSGEDEVEPSEPKPQWPEPKYAEARLEFYAKLAWLPDYTEVYLLEAELNGAYADVEEH